MLSGFFGACTQCPAAAGSFCPSTIGTTDLPTLVQSMVAHQNDPSKEMVTVLDLPSTFVGTVPPDVGKLAALKIFYAASTKVSGT